MRNDGSWREERSMTGVSAVIKTLAFCTTTFCSTWLAVRSWTCFFFSFCSYISMMLANLNKQKKKQNTLAAGQGGQSAQPK